MSVVSKEAGQKFWSKCGQKKKIRMEERGRCQYITGRNLNDRKDIKEEFTINWQEHKFVLNS